MKNQITITLPTIEQVDFTIEVSQDSFERGSCLDSGDADLDKKTEDFILSQLDKGNVWAWACVRVVATWRGQQGDDYLCAASYVNEADFIDNSGYWDDMKRNAYDNLIGSLEELAV